MYYATFSLVAALLIFAVSRSIGLSLLALAVVGGCRWSLPPTAIASLHASTDDAHRGRVLAIFLLDYGLWSFGTLWLGFLAELVEPVHRRRRRRALLPDRSAHRRLGFPPFAASATGAGVRRAAVVLLLVLTLAQPAVAKRPYEADFRKFKDWAWFALGATTALRRPRARARRGRYDLRQVDRLRRRPPGAVSVLRDPTLLQPHAVRAVHDRLGRLQLAGAQLRADPGSRRTSASGARRT